MVQFGLMDLEYTYNKPSMLSIEGKLIFNGAGRYEFAPGLILYIGKDAHMRIGSNFSVSHDTKFYIKKGIIIGEDNMWSYHNVIMDNDGHLIIKNNGRVNSNESIIFGNHVWMGCRCTVLKGARVSDGIIISSSSVVRGSLTESNSIYSGKKIIQIYDGKGP